MRKSLKLLFVAAATFAGAYGLSQPAQALEQSEHCYSGAEISAAMKAEGQLQVAMAFEALDNPERKESRVFYFNPENHTGYIIEGDDKTPVQCAKVIGKLENINLFDNRIRGVDPIAEIHNMPKVIDDNSIYASSCSEAAAKSCKPHNYALANLDASGIKVIFQGTGSESYEGNDIRRYNERLLKKGIIVTIASKTAPDDRRGVILHTGSDGKAALVGVLTFCPICSKRHQNY